MAERCFVSTRKGLFTLERAASGWQVSRASFVGDNCTLTLFDPRSGHLIAALNHGHFGVEFKHYIEAPRNVAEAIMNKK